MSSRRLDHSVSVIRTMRMIRCDHRRFFTCQPRPGLGRFSTVHGAAASVQIRGHVRRCIIGQINGSVAHRAISCRQQCHGKGRQNDPVDGDGAICCAAEPCKPLAECRDDHLFFSFRQAKMSWRRAGSSPEGNIVGHNEMVGKRMAAPGRAGAASFSVKRMACAFAITCCPESGCP